MLTNILMKLSDFISEYGKDLLYGFILVVIYVLGGIN